MTEKAILAIEEALLATLFTQRALIEILLKKGIVKRKDLEKAILKTEVHSIGAGKKERRLYLEKRGKSDRRHIKKIVQRDRRSGIERRKYF